VHVPGERNHYLYSISYSVSDITMKVFQRYLCELCSNAIARMRGNDEVEFVVCATGASGFPSDRRCPQFQFDESIVG